MPPIRLSDDQLAAVMRACEPLRPDARAGFLEAIADRLRDLPEPGDGQVFQVVREVQRMFFDPPDLTDGRAVPHHNSRRAAG